MKKLLALVLALVMTLGLATVSSNAAYADADSIEHNEAVEVLSALGVINGKENNNFDPKGNVKRSEMAKMVAMIMLGSDTDASAFTGAATDLTDVNGHWAEGWIKYCVSQGIISGRGNGKFDPDANVTTSEAAKMLLVAIGYSAKVQGYTGDQWAVNVARDAQLSGFYKELSNLSANKALTRDEAAQIIFNAADATLIEKTSSVDRDTGSIRDSYAPYEDYRDLFGEVYKTSIKTGILAYSGNGSSKGFRIVDRDNGATKTVNNNTGVSVHSALTNADYTVDLNSMLGEEVDVVERGNTNRNSVLGVFSTGRSKVANTTWNNIEAEKDNDGVYTGKIKFGGSTYDVEVPGSDALQYEKGHIATGIGTESVPSAYFTKTRLNYPVKLVDIDGNGKYDLVITTPTQIAQVTYAGSKNVNIKYLGGNQRVTDVATSMKREDIIVYDGIAKDDYVSITNDRFTGDPKFEKLEVLTGTVSGTKTDDKNVESYLIDGTWYKPSASTTSLGLASGDEVKYLVSAGMIYDADVTSGASANDIATVITARAVADNKVAEGSVEAKLLFADGSKKTVTVAKVGAADATVTENATTGNVNKLIGQLVVYTTNSDGEYELKTVAEGRNKTQLKGIVNGYNGSTSDAAYANKQVGGVDLADDAIVLVVKRANASTVASGNDGKVYSGKEFKTNLGANAYGATALNSMASGLYVEKNGFTQVKVAVLTDTAWPTIDQGSNYGYLVADSYTSKPGDGKTYQVYSIWNGTDTITAREKDGKAFAAGTTVTYDVVDADNVKNVAIPTGLRTAAVTGYAGGNDIAFNGTSAKLTGDTKYLFVDSDKKEAAEGVVALASKDSNDNDIANVRYIVDASADRNVLLLVVDVNNEMKKQASTFTAVLSNTASAAAIEADVESALTNGAATLDANAVTASTFKVDVADGQTLTVSKLADASSKVLTVNLADGATLVLPASMLKKADGTTDAVFANLSVKAASGSTVKLPDNTSFANFESANVLTIATADGAVWTATATADVKLTANTALGTNHKIAGNVKITGDAGVRLTLANTTDIASTTANFYAAAATSPAGAAISATGAGTYVWADVDTDAGDTTMGWLKQ